MSNPNTGAGPGPADLDSLPFFTTPAAPAW